GGIEARLAHRPAVTLVAVLLGLRIALAVARIEIHVRAASAVAVPGRGVARVTTGHGRRIRDDVAVIGRAPRVIEVIPVVVRDSAPPERRVAVGKHGQEPRKARVEPHVRPEAPAPVAAAPSGMAVRKRDDRRAGYGHPEQQGCPDPNPSRVRRIHSSSPRRAAAISRTPALELDAPRALVFKETDIKTR